MDSVKARWLVFLRRSSRQEYWIWVLVLMAAQAALTQIMPSSLASFVLMAPWIVIIARRLHDIGRTAWLAGLPAAFGFVVGFIKGFGVAAGWADEKSTSQTAMIATAAFNLILIVLIGVVRGEVGANQYGLSPAQRAGEAHPS